MGIYPRTILTPEHTMNVRTPEEYRKRQRSIIAKNRSLYPKLNWRDPFVVPKKQHGEVYVDGGRWAMRCMNECGNVVVIHPDWRLGLCCECGAVYEDVTLPAERVEIEAELAKRKFPSLRGWKPTESVDRLRDENAHLAARDLADREKD